MVLLFSLDRTDVVDEEDKKINTDDMTENERRKEDHDRTKKQLEKLTRALKWLFSGWTSRDWIMTISKLPERQADLELVDEDDDDDDDEEEEEDEEK